MQHLRMNNDVVQYNVLLNSLFLLRQATHLSRTNDYWPPLINVFFNMTDNGTRNSICCCYENLPSKDFVASSPSTHPHNINIQKSSLVNNLLCCAGKEPQPHAVCTDLISLYAYMAHLHLYEICQECCVCARSCVLVGTSSVEDNN